MHSKGNYKQSEKTTPRMGGNNGKWNNKGLISKIYKWLMQLNISKINNPIKKWAEDLNRHFSKDIQMANKHTKRCSTCYLLEKYKSKLQWDITSQQSEWASSKKKSTNNKCWRECGEKGIRLHCCWECKWIQPLWKTGTEIP